MEKYIKFIKREWANLAFQKHVELPLEEAVISFTFDDAPRSAFIDGGRILEKYGFAGTFYIALTFLDKLDSEVSFSKADLETAMQKTHELACHTFKHIDLSKTKFLDSVADIRENGERFSRLFPDHQFQNFSYPFGAETLAIKKFLADEFRSARGIGHGLNIGKTDLANLKTIKLYRDRYSLAEIEAYIETAIDKKAWLIFYTHDVADNPSPYGCTPAYFEGVVKACSNKKLNVLTIDKTLDLIDSAAQNRKRNSLEHTHHNN